jgi:acetyltransferase-like isoleucine patch superfamily enzyme
MTDFPSAIAGRIEAEELFIGKGVVVESGVIITGKNGPCKRVYLGDFCFIGRDSKIITPEFVMGDYSKLNEKAFCHGVLPLRIGRNCWFGGNVVLDCMGGLDIFDNVGVGSGSQLWTHAQFGDIVEGSRFYSHKRMTVGKDAWLVGHCLVSPVSIGDRSMAMLGSVITSDMLPNHIYGGAPARDLTEKLGTQFEERSVFEKITAANKLILAFEERFPQHKGLVVACDAIPDDQNDRITYLDLSKRSYTRRYSKAEVDFFKMNVPLIKLVPYGEPPLF